MCERLLRRSPHDPNFTAKIMRIAKIGVHPDAETGTHLPIALVGFPP
jgi:hypothetical protein